MELLLLKVFFLVANIWASYAAARDPSKSKPPSSSERLKRSGMEHATSLITLMSRIVVLIFPICEIAAILSLYDKTGSALKQIITAIVPTTNASRITITPVFMIFSTMAFFGAILRWRCCVILGHYFSFNLAVRSKQKIITHGPYAFIRHPSYTGAIMMVFGTLACQFMEGSWLSECTVFQSPALKAVFVLVLSVPWFLWVSSRMNNEDKMLKNAFGKEWEAWRDSVPYRLVPGIY